MLSPEQLKHWHNWRRYKGEEEYIVNLLCPPYMRQATTFPQRLVACYWQRVAKNEMAANPALAVRSAELAKEIRLTLLASSAPTTTTKEITL